MINLLPYDQKRVLTAARTNTVLLRYNIILLLAAGFLVLAAGVVYVFLIAMQNSANTTIADNQRREASYQTVKQEASAFQAKLSDAKTIFDSELSYSTALVRFADLFPSGTAISEINLNEQSFSAPMEIVVRLNKDAADSLVSSLTTSKYVSGFTKKSVAYNEEGKYRYSWTISFSLKKEIAKP